MNRTHTAVATALTLIAGAATAAPEDMTLTPATNGAVVIQTPAAAPALRVQPTGAVQLPLLPAASAGSATDKPVCHDASGTLLPCDPAAIGTPGPAGPTGPTGTTGPAGPVGPAGANGKSALVATATEPAGANCATGGVRVQYGLDANSNGTLDAGEVDAALTRYVCNGAQGPMGPTGPAGPAGSGAGVTGLTEARHGCFDAAGTPSSGAGYAVALNTGVYTVTFAPALGAGNYTLLLDARTSTGRALAVTTGGDVTAGLTFTPGWLDAGGETITRICFMLAR